MSGRVPKRQGRVARQSMGRENIGQTEMTLPPLAPQGAQAGEGMGIEGGETLHSKVMAEGVGLRSNPLRLMEVDLLVQLRSAGDY